MTPRSGRLLLTCRLPGHCALFLPASFSVLGAWGPAIRSLFDTLWQEKIQKALDSGDPTWPVAQRKLAWRSKISVTLMRANAQMVLSCRMRGFLLALFSTCLFRSANGYRDQHVVAPPSAIG
jgi:hypothetical protein